MQFALIELKKDFLHLVAAEELEELQTYADAIKDREFNDKDVVYHVAYGAFLPSHTQRISKTTAIEFLKTYEDYRFAYLDHGECINFGIKNFMPLKDDNGGVSIFESGLAWSIPFACLVETDGNFQFKESSFSRSCFLRAVNVSPADNVFVREGIVAINAEEKRIPKDITINPSNWESFVHLDRIQTVAKSIY